MFESLTNRLSGVFDKLRGRGKLREKDVDEALREVRRALLEADVSLPVVKEFIANVREAAVGEELWKSLTPAQLVIKHVRDQLTIIMGGEAQPLQLKATGLTTILIVGLNGTGKTTTSAKLARRLKEEGRTPLLAATDVYRPAAIQQLEVLGKNIGVPVFQMGDQESPVDIAKAAQKYALDNNFDTLIVDTAGRLHVDEELMDEIEATSQAIEPDETLLIVDAMTGQDAIHIAEEFGQRLKLSGIIMTKMDGDARGGAALSIRHVTGSPIKFIGSGEKTEALEVFHPDRLASRILGMGDVLSLIEKAEQNIELEEAQDLEKKIREGGFNLEDFLKMSGQMRKLGPLKDLMKLVPGFNKIPNMDQMNIDDKQVKRVEAIVQSMTLEERRKPEVINGQRKKRIAGGSGVQVQDVNKLLQQFSMMQNMMTKMMGGPTNPTQRRNERRKKKKRHKNGGSSPTFRLPFR